MRRLVHSALLLLGATLYFLPQSVLAREADGDSILSNFVYRGWNNQTGLPQNTVYDLTLDNEGFLWGATEEGLFRFDGGDFTIFNEGTTPGIESNTFYALASRGNNVWACNRNALVRIGKKVEQLIDLSQYTQGGWIKCMEIDKAGRIWIGSSNGNLFYYYNGQVRQASMWNQSQAGSVDVLRWSPQGLLVGTTRGLFLIQPETGAAPLAISYFAKTTITSLVVGQDREVWVGTGGSGLVRLSKDTLVLTEQQGLRENYINSLYYAPDGRLWIGYRSAGFQIYEKNLLHTPEQGRYAHDGIRVILSAGSEVTWIGTNSSGLIQIKPALIRIPPASSMLNGRITLAIYQHPNGDIWVGTAGRGVTRLQPNGKVDTYQQNNGLSNNLVLSVYGRGDYIYVGTSNGLDRFNLSRGVFDRHYTTHHGLRNNGVLSIFTDSENIVWITTRQGGLHRMDMNDRIEQLTLPADVANATLLCAFEDAQGNRWFGSRGAGTFRIDRQGSISTYNHGHGFPADIVYSFFQDSDGDIWMATEKGLVVMQRGRFRVFGQESGLRFNETYRILQDPDGYIWLSGNQGLQRIALHDLLLAKHTIGESAHMSVRLFNEFDGMPNAEANGGFFPAGWGMLDGTLWFPTSGGVAIADSRLVREQTNKLNIQIQSLRFGDEEFFGDKSISLPPGVYNFEIRYTSIDFAKASDIKYHYRLKGLSNTWTAAGNRHIAYFSALQPGKYIFEVRAERYGEWSPTVVMEFTVQPHFYQTIWFKILTGLLLLGLAAGVVFYLRQTARRKIREQQLINKAQIDGQEKERQLISIELHDGVNQQLSTAKIYLDYARTHEPDRAELIAKSAEVVHKAINDIRDLCHSLTPPGLKDMGFKEALQDMLHSYEKVGKFIPHLRFELPDDVMGKDLQFTLYRITQEQLNNIGRHAGATNVWLEFKAAGPLVQVTITDDGKGFDLTDYKGGLGFSNMRNRLSLYQGKMDIRSTPGNGCTLQLQVPLKAKL